MKGYMLFMRRKLFLFTVLLVFIIVLTDYAGLNLTKTDYGYLMGESNTYEGRVVGIEECSLERTILIVEVEPQKMRLLLTVYGYRISPQQIWKADISFTGTIEEPAGRRNPGCFDYQKHLKSEGIFGVITVEGFKIKKEQKKSPENILIGAKYDFMESLSAESRGMISGVLFGDTENLSEDIYEQFRENGTAHILAVSGLHAGILYGLIRKITGKKNSAVSLIFITLFFAIYCFLSAWSISVIRATLMILLKEWGRYFDLRYDTITAASAVSLILIIHNPYTVFNTGFQMSFLAVLSMAFFQRHIPSWIPDSISMMMAVNLGLIPYQIFQFNIFSISSFLANLPIIYISGIAMPLALMQFLAFSLLGFDEGLRILTEAISLFLIKINQSLSLGEWGHTDMVSMPLWILIMFYLCIFFLASEYFEIMLARKKFRLIILNFATFLTISAIIGVLSYEPICDADLLFIDVGQGDCVHIRSNETDILIDGGGSINYDVGTKVLKPYLLKNGVKKVDMALATHLHTDHYKGLKELYAEKMIEEILSGQIAGNSFVISDNIKIKTLWPLNLAEDTGQDENENCSVFMIYYNDYRVLVTGDLDASGEKQMAEHYRGTGQLKADILKIGHHGSSTSTCEEFLDAVNPTFAVIQVGKNNYGHPSSKVIEKCREKGIILLRNDTHGCVGFSLSGEKITYGIQSKEN